MTEAHRRRVREICWNYAAYNKLEPLEVQELVWLASLLHDETIPDEPVGPWFCERCGREWTVEPPADCPDDGGTICEGTP